MTENEKRKMVEDFIGAYNSFDIEGMMRFAHPDIEFINISGGEANVHTHGIEQFKQTAEQGKALFVSRSQSIKKITVHDDNVFTEIAFKGVLAVDMHNTLKKGEELQLEGKSDYSFKDGLIVKITDIG